MCTLSAPSLGSLALPNGQNRPGAIQPWPSELFKRPLLCRTVSLWSFLAGRKVLKLRLMCASGSEPQSPIELSP